MSPHHWQLDLRHLPLFAWVGVDSAVVFGMKLVLGLDESETSFRGRYLSLWLGPVYLGVEVAS